MQKEKKEIVRDGKRCEWCERCSCKEFPSGVKSLVKQDIKGGVKMSNVFDNSWKQKITSKALFHFPTHGENIFKPATLKLANLRTAYHVPDLTDSQSVRRQ